MDYNFFESEEFADALRSYEQWMETGEPFYLDCDQLMDIAEYYHYHGYSDLALRAAEKAHQLFEEAVPPLVFKARILLLVENKPEEAMAVAEQIEDKLDLDYFYIKAEIMIACDQAEKAEGPSSTLTRTSMLILAVIGAFHLMFIWSGDILLLYAQQSRLP